MAGPTPFDQGASGGRIARAGRIAVPVLIVAILAIGIWRLALDTAGERREAPAVPVIALTPPPPPPPPPKPPDTPPEPSKTIDAPSPAPASKPDAVKSTDAPKQLTINGPPQAGADVFGVASGTGGGTAVGGDPNGTGTGLGGDFGAAAYRRFLGAALQQAIQADERVSRLFFTAEVRIWIAPDGGVSNVVIAKSSGDERMDRTLVAALLKVGRLDQPPPPQLKFPALVALRGRRA